MAAVALVGTLDTKGPDYAFLAARLRAAGAAVVTVDAGTGDPVGLVPDIDGETVAAAAGTSWAELRAVAARNGCTIATAGQESLSPRNRLSARFSPTDPATASAT